MSARPRPTARQLADDVTPADLAAALDIPVPAAKAATTGGAGATLGRRRAKSTKPTGKRRPDLRQERALLRGGARLVAGMDEVGRGSLAGPVSVGVVVVDMGTKPCPQGLMDSKLLTPQARESLLNPTRDWCVAWAVGHAGAAEIDAHGLIAALRMAGGRALAQVRRRVGDVDAVLLDGNYDWLTTPAPDLFDAADEDGAAERRLPEPMVRTQIKADLTCASVAAASVLAKCERDALMTELARQYPDYGWDQNKGYGAVVHLAALRELGPTPLHRRSWRLPAPIAADAQDDVMADAATADELRSLVEFAGDH